MKYCRCRTKKNDPEYRKHASKNANKNFFSAIKGRRSVISSGKAVCFGFGGFGWKPAVKHLKIKVKIKSNLYLADTLASAYDGCPLKTSPHILDFYERLDILKINFDDVFLSISFIIKVEWLWCPTSLSIKDDW